MINANNATLVRTVKIFMEIPSARILETENRLQSGQVSCFRNAKRFSIEAGFVPGALHLNNAAFQRSAAEPQPNTPSPPSDGGEGWGEEGAAALLGPLLTPASWGEEEQKRVTKIV